MAHHISGGALDRHQSQPTGPIIDEALRRLSVHGRNGPWRFVDQFNNLLILLLLRAAVLLGHSVDASAILGVVLIKGMMGFVQEGKAENALTAICTMLQPIAAVLRDGQCISCRVW
ncbi:hypothetical protein GE253_24985 [Niveispirillum sp. SYP-B3756]|uniref:hypothetical protein n=1 Tax=Niveispirillum sp. SYP-B3756 TaxID=2662178 RepID=UPI00129278B6|nr:hypothetical protein [Niveispirillum sp. SYP-B3756]MQP68574.1 hypothetical protein [Niveispirillum sp. SYP-B3756]